MAYQIEINSTSESPVELAETLEKIAKLIADGYTSGYYPTWSLIEVSEDEDN